MSDGELMARYYATGQPVRLAWVGGKITTLEPAPNPPPENLWLAPPLVDLQINGFGGIDFQQDQLTVDQVLAATRRLRAAGCCRYLFTLISDEWPRLMARLRHARNLRMQSAELREAIAGWHVEGPFLSAELGFCGAHNPAVMCDATPGHIRELREITGGDSVLLTLAPERPGAVEAITQAVALGFKVSLGHTNASAETLAEAVRAGATGFTHLGNGCPRDLNRHDNILWRVFETRGVKAGLIPDAIHVSPALFRLVHRTLGADSIYYTTDAMAAAGAPPGRYPLGRLDLEVGADQIVRLPGKPNFAGSALAPIDGVFRAAEMLRRPWQEVWRRFAEAPAELMGWLPALGVNRPADFCLLEVTRPNQLKSLRVFVGGQSGRVEATSSSADA